MDTRGLILWLTVKFVSNPLFLSFTLNLSDSKSEMSPLRFLQILSNMDELLLLLLMMRWWLKHMMVRGILGFWMGSSCCRKSELVVDSISQILFAQQSVGLRQQVSPYSMVRIMMGCGWGSYFWSRWELDLIFFQGDEGELVSTHSFRENSFLLSSCSWAQYCCSYPCQ